MNIILGNGDRIIQTIRFRSSCSRRCRFSQCTLKWSYTNKPGKRDDQSFPYFFHIHRPCPFWNLLNPWYPVVNADEGGSGTCKDRETLRGDPHKLIEGYPAAGHPMDANVANIDIRGEFSQKAPHVQQAIEQLDGLQRRILWKERLRI